MSEKIVIGKEEWCGLPELGLPAIKARVDSGAKTSSLHAFNIHTFEEDGKKYVHFDIHPIQDNRKIIQSCRGLVEIVGMSKALAEQKKPATSLKHRLSLEKKLGILRSPSRTATQWATECSLAERR
jgi:ribosomal protein S6--L-glutamate ligase